VTGSKLLIVKGNSNIITDWTVKKSDALNCNSKFCYWVFQ
jgi:hypothetical protein